MAVVVCVLIGTAGHGWAARTDAGFEEVRLQSMTPISACHVGIRQFRVDDKRVEEPAAVGSRAFGAAVGVETNASLVYELRGRFTRLEASVGVSTRAASAYAGGKVRFRVLADSEALFESVALGVGDEPKAVSADLTGRQLLVLETQSTMLLEGDPRLALWADTRLRRVQNGSANHIAASAGEITHPGILGPVRVSPNGREGLMQPEIAFLERFIREEGFPRGSELLIYREGLGFAIDLRKDISLVAGHGVEVGTIMKTAKPPETSWCFRMTKHTRLPIKRRPRVVVFEVARRTPKLTDLDVERVEGFLSDPLIRPGDVLFVIKKGKEAGIDWEERVMNPLEYRKLKRARTQANFPALDILRGLNELVGARAEVDAGGRVIEEAPHTLYVVEKACGDDAACAPR